MRLLTAPARRTRRGLSTIEMALDLARLLRRASGDVRRLTNGGSTIAYDHSGGGGRVGDKHEAMVDWAGPHRDRFRSLLEQELADSEAAVVSDVFSSPAIW